MRNTTIPKLVSWDWVEREIARHLQITAARAVKALRSR